MKKGLLRLMAILLSICLLTVSFAGCGNQTVTSTPVDNGDVYGDAVDYEDGDEDVNVSDTEVVVSNNGGTSDSSTNDNSVNNNSANNNSANNNSANNNSVNNNSANNNSANNNSANSNSANNNNANNNNANSNSANNNSVNNNSVNNNSTNNKKPDKVTDSVTSKPKEEHKIDENEKKDFLDTIPKELSGKTVEILIWWNPGVGETAKMKEFTEKTGIKVKFITTSSGGYYQKLSAMINQGNAPDLACILQENFPACVMQDYFVPLSEGKFDLKDKIYDIDTMDMFKYNDKYYGAMIKGSTMVTMYFLAYNADMFKKSGLTTPNELWKQGKWNWDTFLSTSQSIMQKNPSLRAAVTGEYNLNYLVQTAGTDPVKYSGGKLINNCKDEKLIKAWQFLNDLKDKYKISDPGLNTKGFYDGSAAMVLTGNYVMQKGDSFETKMVYNWGFAPLPCPAGSEFTVSSSAKLWGLPKGSKDKEAASYALRYWLDSTYDVKGSETWINDSVAEFNNWLWEQPKTYSFYTGVVDYGGNYKWSTMTAKLAGAGADNVKSELDSWSSVIDSNIEKIYREFGK